MSTTTSSAEGPPTEPHWVRALRSRAWTLAVAESMSAGLLSARLAAQPGSGDVFAGGVVTYHTTLKKHLLGVDGPSVISAPCAQAMAEGAARLCRVDVGLSITGVAGPATQEDKPVGLVYAAMATPHGSTTCEWTFAGDAYEIRMSAVDAAVQLLDGILAEEGRQGVGSSLRDARR